MKKSRKIIGLFVRLALVAIIAFASVKYLQHHRGAIAGAKTGLASKFSSAKDGLVKKAMAARLAYYENVRDKKTVPEVIDEVGETARLRFLPYFEEADIAYPPDELTLVVLKQERIIELWAGDGNSRAYIKPYTIRGASGIAGPKLAEGDRQVPEGIYRITWLHPNSWNYLGMKLDYPNRFDRARAREDNRKQLGGDIFIHGGASSIGCLAIGDFAIEELFVMVNDVGRNNVRVIIAPNDLRYEYPEGKRKYNPDWLPKLYANLESELNRYVQ